MKLFKNYCDTWANALSYKTTGRDIASRLLSVFTLTAIAGIIAFIFGGTTALGWVVLAFVTTMGSIFTWQSIIVSVELSLSFASEGQCFLLL